MVEAAKGRVAETLRLCAEHARLAQHAATELARARLLHTKAAYSRAPRERAADAGDAVTVAADAHGRWILVGGGKEAVECAAASYPALIAAETQHTRAALASYVAMALLRAGILDNLATLEASAHAHSTPPLRAAPDPQAAPQPNAAADDTSDDEDGVRALFDGGENVRPAENTAECAAPTTAEYVTPDGALRLQLSLATQHSLWGHHVWNGARWVADWLAARPGALAGRRVVELGAGAGLASVAAARLGRAAEVLATDYPDDDLIANLRANMLLCVAAKPPPQPDGDTDGPAPHVQTPAPEHASAAAVEPFLWGNGAFLAKHRGRFGVVLLCDVVFNHSEHGRLLQSCDALLAADPACAERAATHGTYPAISPDELAALLAHGTPAALCVFTHYRPWLAHRDMAFLERAARGPWAVRHVESRLLPAALFPEDAHDPRVTDPAVLRTVHAYVLLRREQDLDLSGDERDP